ncbi:hypothetical protein IAQ61_008486 [Plenodomus lingam]|uniref:uncharacterized protein n=1 Tax=Leptosphaeria maculans TaxID=5022 RepID=UPI00332A10E6|nr:hypothetical protein IAQ61_008486 [Plenodomus lingam]
MARRKASEIRKKRSNEYSLSKGVFISDQGSGMLCADVYLFSFFFNKAKDEGTWITAFEVEGMSKKLGKSRRYRGFGYCVGRYNRR